MKVPPFRLHRPETTGEASSLASRFGFEAAYLAGGTELVLLMKLGLAAPAEVIDIKSIASLRAIEAYDDHLDIGAGATHSQIAKSPLVADRIPELSRVESILANRRVRTSGTLAGNLCFSDPHSDPATLLTALGASVLIVGTEGERRVSLDDFILGPYATDLREGELVESVRVSVPAPQSAVAHERFKLKERPAVTVAAYLTMNDSHVLSARVVAGAVEPRPRRLPSVEALIVGSATDVAPDVARAAAADVDPQDDAEASAAYKRHLVGVLATRAVARTFEASKGIQP